MLRSRLPGTLVGPILVAAWFAVTASHRVEAATMYLVTVLFTGRRFTGRPGRPRSARDDGSVARSVALGVFVAAGLFAARRRLVHAADDPIEVSPPPTIGYGRLRPIPVKRMTTPSEKSGAQRDRVADASSAQCSCTSADRRASRPSLEPGVHPPSVSESPDFSALGNQAEWQEVASLCGFRERRAASGANCVRRFRAVCARSAPEGVVPTAGASDPFGLLTASSVSRMLAVVASGICGPEREKKETQ